jgi:hypothetical protein
VVQALSSPGAIGGALTLAAAIGLPTFIAGILYERIRLNLSTVDNAQVIAWAPSPKSAKSPRHLENDRGMT